MIIVVRWTQSGGLCSCQRDFETLKTGEPLRQAASS